MRFKTFGTKPDYNYFVKEEFLFFPTTLPPRVSAGVALQTRWLERACIVYESVKDRPFGERYERWILEPVSWGDGIEPGPYKVNYLSEVYLQRKGQ